jgi:hypothetical protein
LIESAPTLLLTFIPQHPAHLANSNTSSPYAVVVGRDVLLSYDSDVKAAIRFHEVATFRVGDPNDEGFFGGGTPGIFNDSIYCWKDFPKIQFFDFYQVSGFDWSNGLIGTDVKELIDRSRWAKLELRHFVYFMKDGTFECLCKTWEQSR